eukprot:scaffold89608_cov25-Cyclotella_meneghiniana.AAC.1
MGRLVYVKSSENPELLSYQDGTRLIVEYTTTQEEHVTLTLKGPGIKIFITRDSKARFGDGCGG